ncbi:TPA: Blp family class II bacteriocin [Streptococcus suis]
MNTKTFNTMNEEMLAQVEGGNTNWSDVRDGTIYGAGIGVSLCAAGGMLTAGATWMMVGACAWAGAKFGAALPIIFDNIARK